MSAPVRSVGPLPGTVAALALLLPVTAAAVDAYSTRHRLVGPAPASVAASGQSAQHVLYVVGGSGTPVGISASANASLVGGGASNLLPTDRIFGDGLGD